MSTEHLHTLAQDARLLAAFEHVISPMLYRMLEVRLETIRSKVRTGERDFIVECTELAFIKDLISEIETHKKRGVIAAHKLEDMDNGLRR